jgi:hypothetical protein
MGDAESSLGDAESSLGAAKSSLGDVKSSLGDADSSLQSPARQETKTHGSHSLLPLPHDRWWPRRRRLAPARNRRREALRSSSAVT